MGSDRVPVCREFSIITAAYNAERYISDAIKSVLAQEHEDWELLIVDDGSSDRTFEIASLYASQEPRIRVWRQENQGTASARNLALAHATSRWALVLDADDMLDSLCLSTYQGFIDANPGYAFFSCNGQVLNPNGSRVPLNRGTAGLREYSAEARDVLYECSFLGALFLVDVVRSLGGYTAGEYNEDHDLWLRLLLAGNRHRYCPADLMTYRFALGSKTLDYERVARSSLNVVKRIDPALLGELGLTEERDRAVASWRSRLVIAEAQSRLASGDYAGARRVCRDGLDRIRLGASNVMRVVAILVLPGLYRRWLRRDS